MMELSTTATIGAIALVLSAGGSYMASQTDIAVNTNNINHITKQLDRIESMQTIILEHRHDD